MSATPVQTTGTAIQPSAVEKMGRFADFMAGRARLEDNEGHSEDIVAQIALRTLDAKTEDEVWDADEGGMPGGKDMIDVELRITGIQYIKSKRDDIKSIFGNTYLIVNAAKLADGKDASFNTSAPGIVTKLVKFEQLGKFSDNGHVDGVIRNVGDEVKTILTLKRVPVRAI